MYEADVKFRYQVGGVEYSSDRVMFGDFSSSSSRRARAIVGRYPFESQVDVYYHPDDPALSVLEPGLRFGNVAVVSIGGVFAVIGGAMLTVLLRQSATSV